MTPLIKLDYQVGDIFTKVIHISSSMVPAGEYICSNLRVSIEAGSVETKLEKSRCHYL